ncbi:HlyD family efflux transporter periplasmic adaptor subunit [Defluviitalea raffinosedens]|jgi:putative membrane fusion protein|uniref:HlyD family efflux transporter periplasmic adaptor subunit n=1 Tax=Defluviitalea raffinosedens TaxID=1450156 RepID=A0A7C8HIB1_9FIRM|nr:HlyD family efflux transporter periplasmic adaptor subunit [Defluviitalea raffinosedens]KAE9637154.1 hypothetical protein GND95_01625 [Defluviitalea raffinosedens]MBM7686542.1 putative membrane fusion protein [Defluviitalea raffinosedens]MBZ4669007.1 HlyD family secretion protein [Defluviitaleaceae bacterium]
MANTKTRKKRKNHKQKRKERRIVIGGFLSVILMIYLIGSGFKLTKKIPLSIEVVQMGTIDNNIHVKGIIVRDETVIKSTKAGNIQYFIYEGEKVKSGTPICMVANNSALSQIQKELDKINENIIKVQDQRKEFSTVQKDIQNVNYQIDDLIDNLRSTYSNKNFIQIYSIKNSIQVEIEKKQILLSQEDSSSLKNLVLQKNTYENQLAANSDVVLTPKGGIISYYIDGLEEKFTPKTLDNLAVKDLEQNSEPKDISQMQSVEKNAPLFKIINNYDWYIVGSLSADLAKDWEVGNQVSIQFNDGQPPIKAKIYKIKPVDHDVIFVFQTTEQMTPLISKRNIEFEIVRENYEGIKIPVNSIVEKTFLKIPKEYVQQSGRQTVVIKKGMESDELIPVEMAFEDEKNIYILQEASALKMYDTLVLPENTESEYVIKESQSSIGVFAVNGGIIRFKKIEILVQNNDYAIVKQDTPSGIRLYDQIVSNAKNAKDNQLLDQFQIIEND